ncbi:D-glycero-beta-D-manno-heptose-7-phosphate kinase [bacterium]|nr:D-glycero-beta-D-manno-heptose-7-phosphate kinase [candidate division CSSED10-310 bacterium]
MDIDQHIRTIAQFQNMTRWCDRLPGRRILVVGDIMVDEYVWGEVRRISPEAPVPVVWAREETTRLGGAANVVHNLVSLEGSVSIIGIVGDDELGRMVIRQLEGIHADPEGIVVSPDHQTIRKTRIVAHNQQMIRVDRETIRPLSRELENRILENCLRRIPDVDAVLISDYDKSVVTANIARSIIREARNAGKICAIDPKIGNIDNYKHCTILTPNHHEAARISGIGIDEANVIRHSGEALMKRLEPEALLITCGEMGMALFERDEAMQMIDTVTQAVYDVTGAGDTAISALTLGLSAGMSFKEAAVLANFAAGVAVGKFGTATVSIPEIKNAMKRYVT